MKKVAVVTGASGGIGSHIAEMLFNSGYAVYNLSRHGGKGEAVHIPTDVSDEKQVLDAFCRIGEKHGHIDLLVNNAGFGISGAAEFTDSAAAKNLFNVNFFGAFLCIKYAVPYMRACKGRIVNVSSAAAVFPIPFQSFYSASKAAINSLTLALRNELLRFGISVCAVMPGDVRTGFTDARQKNEAGDDLYGEDIRRSVAVMEHDETHGMTPESVAAYICKIARKKHPAPLYTAGAQYKLLIGLSKILPQRLQSFVLKKLYVRH